MILYFILALGFQGHSELRASVEALIGNQSFMTSVAYANLTTGESFGIHEDDQMHAASTMKVPVMMTLFHKIDQGELSPDQLVAIENAFTSIVDATTYRLEPDPSDPLFAYLGQKRPLIELIKPMITHSSNLATNLLIELAKPQDIMKLMTRIGCRDIRVRRGVMDLKAYDLKLNNECHAADMALIMQACATSPIFSEQSRRTMIEILRQQEHTDMIPRGVAADSGAQIANKTGSISTVEHDAAYIELANGQRYVLVVFTRDFGDQRQQAIRIGSQISARIYQHLSGH